MNWERRRERWKRREGIDVINNWNNEMERNGREWREERRERWERREGIDVEYRWN